MPTGSERAEVGRRGRSSATEIALLLLLQKAAVTTAVLLAAKGRESREALLLLRVESGEVGTIAGRAAERRMRAV